MVQYRQPMLHALPLAEILRVLVFLLVAGTVFVLAARVLYRRWRRRVPVRAPQFSVLLLAGLGLGCLFYGAVIEPRQLEVTRTRVQTSRLPAGHPGIRIVHLSDLHSDTVARLESELPARVAALHPDLIVFTGDAANSTESLNIFRTCLGELTKIAPTFAVKGNWDIVSFIKGNRFAGTGATVLDGTSASLAADGVNVHVVGLAYGSNTQGLNAALAALPADGPAIVLMHMPYPDAVSPALASRVDLMCAGHTHGGQVTLPFYGALITLSKWGKRFESGFYPNADGFGFPLYVSRGIGMGRPGPRVRFLARPEVAVIELLPSSAG